MSYSVYCERSERKVFNSALYALYHSIWALNGVQMIAGCVLFTFPLWDLILFDRIFVSLTLVFGHLFALDADTNLEHFIYSTYCIAYRCKIQKYFNNWITIDWDILCMACLSFVNSTVVEFKLKIRQKWWLWNEYSLNWKPSFYVTTAVLHWLLEFFILLFFSSIPNQLILNWNLIYKINVQLFAEQSAELTLSNS